MGEKSDGRKSDHVILVQTADVSGGAMTPTGPSDVVARLSDHADDIQETISTVTNMVQESAQRIDQESGFGLEELTVSFAVAVGGEVGLVVAKGSLSATFEVTVKLSPRK